MSVYRTVPILNTCRAIIWMFTQAFEKASSPVLLIIWIFNSIFQNYCWLTKSVRLEQPGKKVIFSVLLFWICNTHWFFWSSTYPQFWSSWISFLPLYMPRITIKTKTHSLLPFSSYYLPNERVFLVFEQSWVHIQCHCQVLCPMCMTLVHFQDVEHTEKWAGNAFSVGFQGIVCHLESVWLPWVHFERTEGTIVWHIQTLNVARQTFESHFRGVLTFRVPFRPKPLFAACSLTTENQWRCTWSVVPPPCPSHPGFVSF